MVRSLHFERGGVTKASIKRANFLAEKHKIVIIATFLYQQLHSQIIKELYDRKILSKNVKVVNFFRDLKPERKGFKPLNNRNYLIKEKGFIEFPDKKKSGSSYRYYKDGFYVKYKRFNPDGTLKFIDYMDNSGHRIRREELDDRGVLVRIRQMDKFNNKPRLDQYFDDKGQCFLTVHVNPENGKEGRTALFNDDPKEYDGLHICQQEWLNSILDKIKFPVVTCELRGLDKFLIGAKHNNIRKIAVAHHSHLEEPFNDIKRIKNNYKRLFKNVDKMDKIVFLTHEQKEDVETIYGENSKFMVIPHACQLVNEKEADKTRADYNPRLAVTLARYHEDKRLDEAINAFKHVVEEVPDAKYYIYGYGNLKVKLNSLIRNLGLEDNVFLKQYISSPQEAFRNAACSILTSRQEAFAMVITESMASGTPVIAYNVKYGPTDIINNGVNSFLIEQGDQKELAEKIIKVMKDGNLREELSRNAIRVGETFSEQQYREQWLELIN